MYLCSSYCLLFIFSVSDSLIYMIYCRSFNFPYVICYYLYLHTWITSLDHVHVYLLCTHLASLYVLAGVANNPGSSCPDPRDWTVAALLYLIRVRSRPSRGGQSAAELGRRRSSSSQFLSCLAPEALLLYREPLCYVYLFMYCILLYFQ